MSAAYPTALQSRSAAVLARNLTADAVHARREEIDRFLDDGVRLIQQGQFAGIPSDWLDDFARGLHDKVSDAVGIMRRDLDNAGLDPDRADVDMAELDAALVTLAREARRG